MEEKSGTHFFAKRIKEKINISTVFSRYTQLHSRGEGKYVCLCPLHHEKTPSCHINDSLGVFYCFGCKEGGDLITFLQKKEGISFSDFPEFIRKNYGIDLNINYEPKKRNILQEVFQALKEGIKEQDIRILDSFLSKKIGKNVEKIKEIVDIIFVSKENIDNVVSRLSEEEKGELAAIKFLVYRSPETNSPKIHSPFTDRIVVPVYYNNSIVGISGRYYKYEEGHVNSKYFHTRFPKKNHLLFLEESKRLANKLKTDVVYVTEGMFDALSLLGLGIPAVSVLGSDISLEQLNLLNRNFKTVYFVFDSDEAGRKARYNVARTLVETNRPSFSSYFIYLPKEKDIDELISKYGENFPSFLKIKSLYDVYIDYFLLISRNAVINKFDVDSIKAEALNRLVPNFVTYRNNEHMDMVMHRFAERSGYPLEHLVRMVDNLIKKNNAENYAVAKEKKISFIPAFDRKIISSLVYLKSHNLPIPTSEIKEYILYTTDEAANTIRKILVSENVFELENYPMLVDTVQYKNIYTSTEELRDVLVKFLESQQKNGMEGISSFLRSQVEKIRANNYNSVTQSTTPQTTSVNYEMEGNDEELGTQFDF